MFEIGHLCLHLPLEDPQRARNVCRLATEQVATWAEGLATAAPARPDQPKHIEHLHLGSVMVPQGADDVQMAQALADALILAFDGAVGNANRTATNAISGNQAKEITA